MTGISRCCYRLKDATWGYKGFSTWTGFLPIISSTTFAGVQVLVVYWRFSSALLIYDDFGRCDNSFKAFLVVRLLVQLFFGRPVNCNQVIVAYASPVLLLLLHLFVLLLWIRLPFSYQTYFLHCLHHFATKAWLSSWLQITGAVALSCVELQARGRVIPGCFAFHKHSCKRSFIDYSWSAHTTCCAIPTSGRRSSINFITVDMACLCRVASVPKLIASLLWKGWICERSLDACVTLWGEDILHRFTN